MENKAGKNINQRFGPGYPPLRNPKSLASALLENSFQDSQMNWILRWALRYLQVGVADWREDILGEESFMSKTDGVWKEKVMLRVRQKEEEPADCGLAEGHADSQTSWFLVCF